MNPFQSPSSIEDGIFFAETPEQKDLVARLRYAIYPEEMGRYRDRADHANKRFWEEADEHARHLLMIQDGEAIGTARLHWGGDGAYDPRLQHTYSTDIFSEILPPSGFCIVERLMVKSAWRGTSATMQIFSQALLFGLNNGVHLFFCDCELHLLNLYLKTGFRTYCKPIQSPGIGMLLPLVGVLWDTEHLRKVGSPLYFLLEDRTPQEPDLVRRLLERIPKDVPIQSHIQDPQSFKDEIYRSIQHPQANKPRIYEGISQEEASEIFEKSHLLVCEKGDRILQAGGSSRALYSIISGVVEIQKQGRTVALRGPGDVFGEFAFLLQIPRSADVVASTEGVRILCLSESNLKKLLDEKPALAAKLMFSLSRCLCSKMLEAF